MYVPLPVNIIRAFGAGFGGNGKVGIEQKNIKPLERAGGGFKTAHIVDNSSAAVPKTGVVKIHQVFLVRIETALNQLAPFLKRGTTGSQIRKATVLMVATRATKVETKRSVLTPLE